MLTESRLIESFKNSFNKSLHMEGGHFAPQKGEENPAGAIASYAQRLSKKYESMVGDMNESWLKTNVVIAMENYSRATKYMQEATKSTAIADFDKYALPLIRAVLPALATNELFSVQPMFGSTSQVFYFNYIYGTTRGTVTAGQKLFENHDPNYGNSVIDVEYLADGDGSTVNFTGNLSHTPIVPGTVSITSSDGSSDLVITDDGSGNLVGDVGAGTNTINYATGAFDVDFSAAPSASDVVNAEYSVDSESSEEAAPEIDLSLTSSPIVARSKKLRMRWSLESQFALRDNFGLEAEAEMVTATAAEIAYGIDTANIDNVKRVAIDKREDAAFQYDRTPPSGVSYTEHQNYLVDYMIQASSHILSVSGRAYGNRIVAGEYVSNIIESLAGRFVPAADIPATRGVLYMGTLDGRWKVFRDMRMAVDEYMVLFKGDQFLHAGYVWAPWITAFSTPTTYLDDMQGRKGMGSLYGQKVVNSNFYVRLKVITT